jgi:hypothetical protein
MGSRELPAAGFANWERIDGDRHEGAKSASPEFFVNSIGLTVAQVNATAEALEGADKIVRFCRSATSPYAAKPASTRHIPTMCST